MPSAVAVLPSLLTDLAATNHATIADAAMHLCLLLDSAVGDEAAALGAALAEKLVGASFYDSAGRVSGVTVEGVPFAGAAPTAAADDDDDDGYDDDEFEEDRAWDAAQKKLQLARDLHALRLSLSTDASDDGRRAGREPPRLRICLL